jgi:putative transposase
MITHKFRLYPNNQIENKLLEALEICRQGYNTFLGELNNQKVIDKSLIQGIIPDMKICDSRFSKVHSKALQYEVYKLFSNLSGLSATKKNHRKVGSLRFKAKGVFKTFTYNQSGFRLDWNNNKNQTLWLSKIGNIPIRCHRKVQGKIKQITIKHFPSGKWYAFVIEDGVKPQKTANNLVVGIDLGLQNIIYDSDGNSIQNPRYLKQKEKRMKHLQRLMSNKQKKSNNRNRFRIQLARQYEKLANSRDDFAHKVSRYYAGNYGIIAFEDINIQNLSRGMFSKSMNDAVLGKIRQFTAYKAENAGGKVMLVRTAGTTTRCSQCGVDNPKEIWEREHNCWNCGFIAPRDYNSALEIKRLCLEKIRQELPEYKHLEMEALPEESESALLTSHWQLLSMKNEAYSKTKVLV